MEKILKSSRGEPVIPRKANRIFIRNFLNKSGRGGIEDRLVIRLEKLIGMDGRLAAVSAVGEADLLLTGDILSFTIQNMEYDNLGQPVKKRMRIIASVNLIDREKNRFIFRKIPVQSFREYSDIRPPVENEYRVINSVIDQLAERIFSNTMTGWHTDKMTREERGK